MSQELVAGSQFTPGELRQTFKLLSDFANTIARFLPESVGGKVKNSLDSISKILENEMVVSLLCYLLNSFGNKEPSKQELAQAVEFFGLRLQATGEAPTSVAERDTE